MKFLLNELKNLELKNRSLGVAFRYIAWKLRAFSSNIKRVINDFRVMLSSTVNIRSQIARERK